eukprot:GHVR01145255.1.p2 GENE.GHVR01145255.1~~GHVR01145255.1.p2  ORF type:complete len:102 (-),score=14.47 GHVR01145255.1:125-430(-)
MKALVQGTRICELAVAEFSVHEALEWVDVADDTTTQDTYVDGAVIKYAPPVLTAAEQAQAEINRLENLETPRRLAEAVLTVEGKTWLEANRALIAVERAKL